MLVVPATLDEVLALPFAPMDDWDSIPDRPGIYFAIIDRCHLVYVGVTGTSLRRRWRYHNHRRRLAGFGDVTVAYIPEDDLAAIHYAELDAIRLFDPVMNDTPGFCVVMEDENGTKRFRRLTWAEGRPRKPTPPPGQG